MTDSSDLQIDLPSDVLQRIEAAAAAFEAEWRQGPRPQMEAFLAGFAGDEIPALLQRLLRLEIDFRERRAETCEASDFHEKFPEYSELIDTVFGSDSASEEATMLPDAAEQADRLGEYILLDKIASGGMGIVYKAWQPGLGRVVALKTVLNVGQSDRENLKRFQKEAEALAQLNHPGIVPVYDIGEVDGLPFFTMAFIDGPSLAARLREGPLPPKEAAQLMATVASIVDSAHGKGVIHRDIKPGNVLLGENDKPFVADFGIARRVDSDEQLTSTGQVLGTPAYMPPEQARGASSINAASDVYALGAVLYATLTGRAPFQAATPLETLLQVLDEEPPSLLVLNRRLPRDLATICHKCLEKRPQDRYASAEEMAADLQRWLSGEPIVARAAGPVERAVKWTRRRPAFAGLVAISMVALMAIGGVVVAWRDNERLEQSLSETAQARQLEAAARSDAENALVREEAARAEAETARDQEAAAREEAERLRDQEAAAKLAEAEARGRAEEATQNLRRADYLRRMALARFDWQQGRTQRVKNMLVGSPYELRGWEWQFLNNLNQQQLLDGGSSAPGIAVSSDGTRLFTSRRLQLNPQEPLFLVRDLSGTRLRSFGDNPSTQVLSLHAGRSGEWLLASTLERSSEDGKGSKLLRIERLDAADGRVVKQYFKGASFGRAVEFDRLALSSDDRFFAAAIETPTEISVYRTETGEQKTLRHPRAPNTHTTGVALSPDGGMLAGAFEDGLVGIWNPDSGELIHTVRLEAEFRTSAGFVTFDSSGSRLAVAGAEWIQVWNVADWSPSIRIASDGIVHMCAFSPDGRQIAVAAGGTTIDIRDTQTGLLQTQLHGHTVIVTQVLWPSQGRLISLDLSGNLKFWAPIGLHGEAVRIRCRNRVTSLAFSPDGTELAVAGGPGSGPGGAFVSVYDIDTFEETFAGLDHYATVQAVSYVPDGRRPVTVSWDHRLAIWTPGSEDSPQFLADGVTSGLGSLAADPAGKWIASSGGSRRFIAIWDVEQLSEARRLKLPDDMSGCEALAVSPDGRWLAVSGPQSGVRIFETDSWQQTPHLTGSESARWTSLTFSPDGQSIAGTGVGGDTWLWKIGSGEHVGRFSRHQLLVTDVTFNRDGSRVATSSADGTVKIWETSTGSELLTLTGHVGPVTSVAFSPDGHLLATGGRDGTVRIYDGTPGNSR